MEKDQVRDLLDLKYHNADTFYKIISEMPIDDVNKLCSSNQNFHHLCGDQGYWERLWRQKIFLPVPDVEVKVLKQRYLKYASMVNLAEFIQKNQVLSEFKEFRGLSTEKIFEKLDELPNFDVKKSLFENRHFEGIFLVGFDKLNLDCLLFGVSKGYQISNSIMVSRNEDQDEDLGKLIDRLFSLLSEKQIISLMSRLSLSDIIALPRGKESCNTDIVEKVYDERFADVSGSENQRRFLVDALMASIKKDCEDLFDFFMKKISKLPVNSRRILIRKLVDSNSLKKNRKYFNRFRFPPEETE